MSARLMVVEDERIVALDLKHNLEYLGYEVVGMSARADEAISLAHSLRPDLILMDIHLEGTRDGTDAALEIRRSIHLPVMFLTAYAEEKILSQAENSAPYGYVIKPFELRELEAAVRMALARRRAELEVERASERLHIAMDAAQLGVWEWDTKSGDFFATGHMERILGQVPTVLRDAADAFLQRIHEEDRHAITAAIQAGYPLNATVRMTLADGRSGWCDLHAKAIVSEGRTRIIGALRDVTERRCSEDSLRQASVVFRTTAEGITILDARRRIISANPAFSALTGYALSEIEGRDPDDFLHARRHSDQFYPRLAESPQGYWLGEIACRHADGRVFPAWQHISAVRDDHHEVTHYVLAISDISAVRQAEAQIKHLAFHDALTGLGNRHMLEQSLQHEIVQAQQSGQAVALLFIDLDGFKLINDSLGHSVGDHLLRTVAQRIHANLRRRDIPIRLGGDEFILVVPEVARPEDCALLAEKLLSQIRDSVELQGDRVSVSASIGIALFPQDANTPDTLVSAADSAMYAAKSRGRNRYAFYSPDMAERALTRMRTEQGLLRALENQEFRLHFQPLVRLADRQICAFEALIRWQHPQQGMVPPDSFIPIAEDTGLIEPIGEWVLLEACRRGVEWVRNGHSGLRMAVNLSVRQMASERLVEHIAAVLADTGFPPDRLELEITESTLQSIEHSQGVLYRLRSLGCSIVIDDFGTGFSSLGLLKHLPINGIKIDRSFVRDLPEDSNDLAIARAIVAMADSLGLHVTAEGIEHPAQARILQEIGCREGQGFLFSRPLPASEAGQLLLPPPRPPH